LSSKGGSRREKIKRGGKRFSKFTVVGFSNFAVDIVVLNLFLWLAPTREPYLLALYNGVAIVAANANSYVWNTLWTFRGRADRGPRQRVLFALQALFGAAVGSGIFWALIRFLLAGTDLPAYAAGNVAKVASVVVASTISFFLMRYVVFSCKRWLSGRL
jgi:putative flippase GtrA